MREQDLEKAKRIEKQVERWDLFAKIAPTLFLFICFILLSIGTKFNTVFLIGMVSFAVTAVVWWFWAIFSIRYLVKVFYNASESLMEAKDEIQAIRKEFIGEKDNSSQSG